MSLLQEFPAKTKQEFIVNLQVWRFFKTGILIEIEKQLCIYVFYNPFSYLTTIFELKCKPRFSRYPRGILPTQDRCSLQWMGQKLVVFHTPEFPFLHYCTVDKGCSNKGAHGSHLLPHHSKAHSPRFRETCKTAKRLQKVVGAHIERHKLRYSGIQKTQHIPQDCVTDTLDVKYCFTLFWFENGKCFTFSRTIF